MKALAHVLPSVALLLDHHQVVQVELPVAVLPPVDLQVVEVQAAHPLDLPRPVHLALHLHLEHQVLLPEDLLLAQEKIVNLVILNLLPLMKVVSKLTHV